MKKIFFQIFIVLLITTSCGFKVYNQAELINFSAEEIRTTGDSRINYNLKNKLISSLKNDYKEKIILIIETKKNKTIKEKNIKNEITKYQISINVSIDYKLIGNNDKGSFVISKSGVFDVNSQYSKTINNEKNLIKSLTVEILDELLNNLRIITDDL